MSRAFIGRLLAFAGRVGTPGRLVLLMLVQQYLSYTWNVIGMSFEIRRSCVNVFAIFLSFLNFHFTITIYTWY